MNFNFRPEFGNLNHIQAAKLIKQYEKAKTEDEAERLEREILFLIGEK
jgi:hypothetical protein